MPEDLQSAIQNSLPDNVTPESLPAAADVLQDSSPVAPVETTTNQVEQKTPPFNEHPRWKEVLEERDRYRDLAMKLAENRSAPQVVQPQQDPYSGMTPEEKTFYQKVEEVADRKVQQRLAEVRPQIENELRSTKETMAALAYERFMAKYPEVRPGSEQEAQIAEHYRRGHTLDDARNIVMRDYDINKAVAAAQGKTQIKIEQKRAANQEQKTIPAVSGLPQSKGSNFREAMAKTLAEAGM